MIRAIAIIASLAFRSNHLIISTRCKFIYFPYSKKICAIQLFNCPFCISIICKFNKARISFHCYFSDMPVSLKYMTNIFLFYIKINIFNMYLSIYIVFWSIWRPLIHECPCKFPSFSYWFITLIFLLIRLFIQIFLIFF